MHAMMQDVTTTLDMLQRALARDYRIVEVEIADTPIFLAVAYPLAPGVTGLKPRLPSGRGTTRAQAMVSAGAEALELRASLAQNNVDRIARLPRVDGRAMVAAHDLLSAERVLVPAQQVFLDFAATTGEPLETDADSTGCAVGATRREAVLRALLEGIERDATAFWWHGGVAASALSTDLIDAHQPRLAWWLKGRSRRFRLLGLTTEIGVPVVLSVSFNPEGGEIACGAAARLDVADAALAAVTEMIQTEVALAAALAADDPEARRWCSYASALMLPQFDPPTEGPPDAWAALDEAGLLNRLADLGLRALGVDLTLADDPLPSVRVIVPGLCAMGGRIDCPRFRKLFGSFDPTAPLRHHEPEPF
jgi:ribosomal protein S12 methylthiotransferase accessory factor YcaO